VEPDINLPQRLKIVLVRISRWSHTKSPPLSSASARSKAAAGLGAHFVTTLDKGAEPQLRSYLICGKVNGDAPI